MRGSRWKRALSLGPFHSGSFFFCLSFRILRCPKDRRRTTRPRRDDVERRGAASKVSTSRDPWFPDTVVDVRNQRRNRSGPSRDGAARTVAVSAMRPRVAKPPAARSLRRGVGVEWPLWRNLRSRGTRRQRGVKVGTKRRTAAFHAASNSKVSCPATSEEERNRDAAWLTNPAHRRGPR